jgi:hypothetical protein
MMGWIIVMIIIIVSQSVSIEFLFGWEYGVDLIKEGRVPFPRYITCSSSMLS